LLTNLISVLKTITRPKYIAYSISLATRQLPYFVWKMAASASISWRTARELACGTLEHLYSG